MTKDKREQLDWQCDKLCKGADAGAKKEAAGGLKQGLQKLSDAMAADAARRESEDRGARLAERLAQVQNRQGQLQSVRETVKKILAAQRDLQRSPDLRNPSTMPRAAQRQRELQKTLQECAKELRVHGQLPERVGVCPGRHGPRRRGHAGRGLRRPRYGGRSRRRTPEARQCLGAPGGAGRSGRGPPAQEDAGQSDRPTAPGRTAGLIARSVRTKRRAEQVDHRRDEEAGRPEAHQRPLRPALAQRAWRPKQAEARCPG